MSKRKGRVGERKPWITYFLDIAEQVATRGTCDRKQVGAVIVRDNRILVTGYNGSIAGSPHCDEEEVGHLMINGHCKRTVHAEINALAQAGKAGVSLDGAICYTTVTPCWECYKALRNAGVKGFIYRELYRPFWLSGDFDAEEDMDEEILRIFLESDLESNY